MVMYCSYHWGGGWHLDHLKMGIVWETVTGSNKGDSSFLSLNSGHTCMAVCHYTSSGPSSIHLSRHPHLLSSSQVQYCSFCLHDSVPYVLLLLCDLGCMVMPPFLPFLAGELTLGHLISIEDDESWIWDLSWLPWLSQLMCFSPLLITIAPHFNAIQSFLFDL